MVSEEVSKRLFKALLSKDSEWLKETTAKLEEEMKTLEETLKDWVSIVESAFISLRRLRYAWVKTMEI